MARFRRSSARRGRGRRSSARRRGGAKSVIKKVIRALRIGYRM